MEKLEVAIPIGGLLEPPFVEVGGGMLARLTSEGQEIVRIAGNVVWIRRL